jgi:hypothetical protein
MNPATISITMNTKEGPKKYNIYNAKPCNNDIMYEPTNEKCGRLYMGYALIPMEISKFIPRENIVPEQKK